MNLIDNEKEFGKLFSQISSVSYVIIYTIGIILFLTMMPSDTLNNYAKYILPATGLLGAGLFYKGMKTNYIENFNINYERIKTIILFLCLITITIVYYTVDPGGYIAKYYGSTLLITILLSVFSLFFSTKSRISWA